MAAHKFPYDMPKVAPKGASEIAIQASCKMRVETQFGSIFMAIPNGGKRGRYAQSQIKREGVRKGAPDCIIIGLGHNAGRIAFAEIKAGSSLSLEQLQLLDDMHANKHCVGVFRSQDTLAAQLTVWGWG